MISEERKSSRLYVGWPRRGTKDTGEVVEKLSLILGGRDHLGTLELALGHSSSVIVEDNIAGVLDEVAILERGRKRSDRSFIDEEENH